MKARTRKLLLLLASSLIASSLTACVSVNKHKQNWVVYDFGLSISNKSYQAITSKILLEKPIAADALNHNKIRYRLNYQNPSRVFFYSESRWATTPSELLFSKVSQMVNFERMPTNCSLKLKIEAFDHVFQTTADSDGIAQLSVSIIEKSFQKVVASQLITEKVTASSPDAQGGAAAIQHASEKALKKAIEWGNIVVDNSELCR
jgi:cholesterol transport system auxiliary component